MFSRRHPYLFFFLVFSGIVGVVILGTSILVAFSRRGPDFDFREKVGVIEISGVISDSRETIDALKRFREDDAVKAIVVRIDSPGGGVGPSQEIFREIQKTVSDKKVVASMGGIATSGGYYVAAATDAIFANPGTITGSIGVIMGFTNFRSLLEKIGLVPVVIKSGEFKDTGSPVRQMTDREKEMLQDLVKRIHQQFVRDVAQGRKQDVSTIQPIADGRIFTGEEALALNLVDQLGNLEDAVEWVARRAGIRGKVSTVYAEKKRFSLWEYLLESAFNTVMERSLATRPYAGYLYQP
ncbi:MAG: signal peptide peptidase SppA [Deltaproteobacteria bacterium]|nr:signal peptide peptidase SppA [Deltaproteobacteria bacterium]